LIVGRLTKKGREEIFGRSLSNSQKHKSSKPDEAHEYFVQEMTDAVVFGPTPGKRNAVDISNKDDYEIK
jgi:hypothetical protein